MDTPATSVSPTFASATQTGETSIKLCRPPLPATSHEGDSAQGAGNGEATDGQQGSTSAATEDIGDFQQGGDRQESTTFSGSYSWTLAEDTILYNTISQDLHASRARIDFAAIELALKDHWEIVRGKGYRRTRNSLRTRVGMFKAIHEVGLNPLTYTPRPWTPEEDQKVLALTASRAYGGNMCLDYSSISSLFVGRPKFEIKERWDSLLLAEKKKEERLKQLTPVDKVASTQPENSTSLPSLNLSSTSQSFRRHSLSRFPQYPGVDSPTPLESPTVQPSTATPKSATAFIPSRPNFFAQFATFSVPSPTESSPTSASTRRSTTENDTLQHELYSSSERKRSRLSSSTSISSSPPPPHKKQHISSPPSPVIIETSTALPSSSSRQGGTWISEEIAREGLKILEKIKKSWDELDKEWDELVAGAKKD